MVLMSCDLLNNADFYFCYVTKMLAMLSSKCANKNVTASPRCARAQLLPTITVIVNELHRKKVVSVSGRYVVGMWSVSGRWLGGW